MENSEIEKLFERVAGKPGEMADDVKFVFSRLVSTTLEYRDQIKENTGAALKVGDVKSALDGLVHFMQSGGIPMNETGVRFELIKKWVDALKAQD